MTTLLQNLIISLNSHPKVDCNEPKKYELFVCNQLLALKQVYIEEFNAHLQKWLQTIHRSIITAINTKEINQIRPKLELIYTSAINQQERVTAQIEKIGDLLGKEVYSFSYQWETISKDEQTNFIETVAKNAVTADGFLLNTANSSLKTQVKSRSQSIGGARRKLSKTSCFAEAKKIEPFKVSVQSTDQFFAQSSASKIKKSKKREQSDFDSLQKCLGSKSPSNFMLNYMAVNISPQQNNLHVSTNKNSKMDTQNEIANKQQPRNVAMQVQKEGRLFKKIDSNQKEKDSDHYEKVMATFEEKIGVKLDQLMDKYTDIEKRLERSISQNNIKSHELVSKAFQPSVQSSLPVEHSSQLNKPKITFIERQPSKLQQKRQKQNKKEQSYARGPAARQITKAPHLKNKIQRNQTEESVPSEHSLEVIQLQTKKQQLINKEKNKAETEITKNTIDLQQSKAVQIVEDKSKIQKMLEDFHQITLKVLLPISKKLLFFLKQRYTEFCQLHQLQPQKSILRIESEPIKDQKLEMRENIIKMEKILSINCAAQKKDKLVLYVNSFLDCYLAFNTQETVRQQQMDKNVETKISKALNLLNM